MRTACHTLLLSLVTTAGRVIKLYLSVGDQPSFTGKWKELVRDEVNGEGYSW